MSFYVMWQAEEDIDDTTFGGGVAAECETEEEAVEVAKQLTEQGHPCTVESETYDIIWQPENEEAE